MPQLTLEYTQNIDDSALKVGELLGELQQTLADKGGIDLGAFKSRAHRLETFRIGDGNAHGAFVHLEVALFSGRSLELRKALGDHCLDVLRHHFAPAFLKHKMQITVEMREIDREAYVKIASA